MAIAAAVVSPNASLSCHRVYPFILLWQEVSITPRHWICPNYYNAQVDKHIAYMIGIQEALGLDVFVHGEPERTDMVEYFGVKLSGFTFTSMGWLQSYGNRHVRPPIVYGDVTRIKPMTVREYVSAQAMTPEPVKACSQQP